MRKIFVCIGFLLLNYSLIAQEEIDRQITALEDSVDSFLNIRILNALDHLHKKYVFLSDHERQLFLNSIDGWFNGFYQLAISSESDYFQSTAADILINSKAQILNYKIARDNAVNSKAKLYLQWITWLQIQEKLQEDEALIDYFSFYDKTDCAEVFHAMLIKKDTPQPVFIPLTSVKQVEELLKAKDNLPLYIQYKEARQEMYGYIWQALEPHLKDIKTIHLSPVASLNKVDFESLQNEQGQYLAGLYDFHYYSSSKDFYKQTESQPDYSDATLYGHIAYFEDHQAQYELEEDTLRLRFNRDTLQPLPATLHEVNAIESICTKSNIHPTLLTIDAAKEDTIAYFSGDRAPGIIHFATHGAYLPLLNKAADKMEMVALTGQDRFRAADNPLQRSMLMLSNAGETWQKSGPNIIADNDGILTALEVTNLDLSNTELVVLSACNSGIGSEHTTEGVFGLPRAFKLAGVDKVLVSLWPVEDETTKELMIQFYTNLLQNKQDAATALRNAKAEMRKRDERPKKWAGFVLVE